ncbi:MAG: ATP-binding protein [Mycobacteriales bacterium]|nr:ATP-binding protein [Mycobacteriales bacterium]
MPVEPSDVGVEADTVEIAIDYAIISHFSQHLYGSPNKAVEELVANGFDALASTVDVWVPGEQITGSVLVWDDGQSMDIGGLKSLWEIARSPKAKVPKRQIVGMIDGHQVTRDMIGKFGIGKLASYAVGDQITHYCRSGEDYLLVNVDYVQVLDENRGTKSYTTPVRRLTKEEAHTAIRSLFTDPPADIDELLERPTWTLARIGRLRADVDLKPGRLSWVIGNGMPLRPDFAVNVNGEAVTTKLSKNAKETWNLETPSLTKAIASGWYDSVRAGDVDGTLLIGPGMSGCIPAAPKKAGADAQVWVETSDEIPDLVVRFPNLGDVRVEVRLFADSLLAKKDEDRPRTHGFFVMVRGRLVNSEDELLFLNDPSFTSFYRTQFVIHADALDTDLLADRERLKRSSKAATELALLQRVLNGAARAFFESKDDEDAAKRSSVSLLPLDNRELYRQPVTALLLARDALGADGDFSDPEVRRVNNTEASPLSDLDVVEGNFLVNQDHPLFAAVRAEAGGGAAAKKFFRVFDVFAVGERLLEGHLREIGLPADQVEGISGWRDRLLRALATRYSLAGEEVIAEVTNASFKGDAPFEIALAKLFRLMGFDASRDGAPGQKDVLTVAPTGPEHYTCAVEAKGSSTAVTNVTAAIASAASHRDKVTADHAIVVAREFSGFKQPKDEGVAILDECTAVGGVSVVTLDVLIDLYKAVQEYSYPLSVILPVLQVVESPDEKRKRVADLTDPLASFDFRSLLESIWNAQRGDAAKDVVAFRSLWQVTDRSIDLTQFTTKLVALEAMSGGLIVVDTAKDTVYMRQSPDLVAARIAKSLAGHESHEEAAAETTPEPTPATEGAAASEPDVESGTT